MAEASGLDAAARKIAASYDRKLPDSAHITVSNGDLRALKEALAAWDAKQHERGSAIEGDLATGGGGGYPR